MTTTQVSPPICQQCGARSSRHDTRFCAFCGAELPRATVVASSPDRGAGLAERFAALEAHPEALRLAGFVPEDAGKIPLFGLLFLGVFSVIWLGGTGLGGVAMLSGGLGAFALVPLGMFALGFTVMLHQVKKYRRFRSAPIRQLAARVADERMAVSGGGRNSSATSSYFTTLEFPDGHREELATLPKVASQACVGELGIAFVRADMLVYFGRVPV